MDNPYETPRASLETHSSATVAVPDRDSGGLKRFPFIVVFFGVFILTKVMSTTATDPRAVLGLSILPYLVLLAPIAFRLKNIGMNQWWCLLFLIPLVNLLVMFRCLACPEGFADTKKLDIAGRVIAFLIIGLILFLVVMIMVILLS